MKIRNTKSVSIDSIQLASARGAILHPQLHIAVLKEYEELEHKGKLCRVPSTILETYHIAMQDRIALFEESCRLREAIVLYHF